MAQDPRGGSPGPREVFEHSPFRERFLEHNRDTRHSEHARALLEVWRGQNLFVDSEYPDPRDRHRIHFAPLPLK